MERNLQKTCEICLKTMRGDTVKIHIKCHEKMNSIDEAETHMSCTVGEMKHVDEAETHRREKTLGELDRNVQQMYKCKCHEKINSIDEAETHRNCTVGEMKHVDEAETYRREKTLGELERKI